MASDQEKHLPDRPFWECRSCLRPWPCAPAKAALLSELGRVEVAVYMWQCLEEAASDRLPVPPDQMFPRFIAWTWGESTPAR